MKIIKSLTQFLKEYDDGYELSEDRTVCYLYGPQGDDPVAWLNFTKNGALKSVTQTVTTPARALIAGPTLTVAGTGEKVEWR